MSRLHPLPVWTPPAGETVALGVGVIAMLIFVLGLVGASVHLVPVELGVPLMVLALGVFAACLLRGRIKARPKAASDFQL